MAKKILEKIEETPIVPEFPYKAKATRLLAIRNSVYGEPSTVGTVSPDEVVEILEEENGFGKIAKGWINVSFVERI